MKSESFIRWQGRSIEQLGYAINLVLTLSTASLGFIVNIVVQKNFLPYTSGWPLLTLGCISLLLSILIGIITVINRVIDFRLTTQIARKREQINNEELEVLRREERIYGKRTWVLFWIQIGLFATGILLFFIAVFLKYNFI